ncbi:MAG TPA: DUF2764 family protein [Candidatus Marinimicrobia bacterium]|nr:DUF2764 family protein [Candidatus Neomarinimicrobiota bacterium]
MDKYYYLAAQIPFLYPDMDEAPSYEWFLEEAAKWLTDKDYKKLVAASINQYLNGKTGSTAGQGFIHFENNLRRELAKYRKARKEDYEYRMEGIPMNLVKEGNPLEIEKKLIIYRWIFLNELEFGHYSDLDFLIITALKLQLLARLSAFDREKGKEIFDAVVSEKLSQPENEDQGNQI